MTEIGTRSLELKTLIILDIANRTEMIDRLGQNGARTHFERHDDLVHDLLPNFGGTVIDKTAGFLLVFRRPIDAVSFSLNYHASLNRMREFHGAKDSSDAVSPQGHLGIHLGEVYLIENPIEDVARGAKPVEVEGLAKPMAARLMSLATPGQTLMTRGAFDLARRAFADRTLPEREVRWMSHGFYRFKGVGEPIEVYEVGIDELSPLIPPPGSRKAQRVESDDTIQGWRPAPGMEIPRRPNWRLTERLGSSTFGEVWLSHHKNTRDPRVFKFCFEETHLHNLQREVTLFRLLRESLGNRRDITRILDWSFDEPPFFIESEYTRGGSLVNLGKSEGGLAKVPLEERLEIIAQAAEALSAAHSVGVLHKDLKPANILLTQDLEGHLCAQLNDFGVSVVTDRKRLEQAAFTVMGFTETWSEEEARKRGSHMYVAPELLEGKPSSTHADIYALGVVLFQIVVGDFQKPLAPGWERSIEDPLLREDIALMTDGSPERRIGNAAEVAHNLRSLEQRRTQKQEERDKLEEAERAKDALSKIQARRRRTGLAFAIVLFFALAMLFQSRRVAHEAERANREATTAREVSELLIDIFSVPENDPERGSTITARELLDQAAGRLERELVDQPATRARLMTSLGKAYMRLGIYDKAESLLSGTLESQKEVLGEEDEDLADLLVAMGQLRTLQGRYFEAHDLLARAIRLIEDHHGPKDPHLVPALQAMVIMFRRQDLFAEADSFQRRLHDLRGPHHSLTTGQESGTSLNPKFVDLHHELSLTRALDLPGPVDRVWGETAVPGRILISAPEHYYLMDMDEKSPPTPIPLAKGEQIVGLLENGDIVFRTANGLRFRSPDQGEKDFRIEVKMPLAKGSTVALSPNGRFAAEADHNRLRIFRIEGNRAMRRFKRAIPRPERFQLVLSNLSLAYLDKTDSDRGLTWISLYSGETLWQGRVWEEDAVAVAIDDQTEHIAIASGEEIVVYQNNREHHRSHNLPGQRLDNGLAFLSDATLAIGGVNHIWMWPRRLPPETFQRAGAEMQVIQWASQGLLAWDQRNHQIMSFAYGNLDIARQIKVDKDPIATLTANPEDSTIYAGTNGGHLARYRFDGNELVGKAMDRQAIQALQFGAGKVFLTAEGQPPIWLDGETLANTTPGGDTSLPIDDTFFSAASQTLWTASTDKGIASWTPDGSVTGASAAMNLAEPVSIWVDEARGLAIAGDLAGSWSVLKKRDSGWTKIRTEATDAKAVRRILPLEDVGLVLIFGVDPNDIWAYDPERDRSWQLQQVADHLVNGVAVHGRQAILVGRDTLVRYRFQRVDGELRYEISMALSTALGDATAAVWLPLHRSIAVSSANGTLSFIELDALERAPLFEGRLSED
ncbi:Non-specific serine/threonine protein kinase [Sulfidibacter corallicola]|uniref:Protein kinase n=1 Tax=Sulfidibacter corallicola TaxID=2818388 RepID=A0A8A4TQT4_SULCO|nr:protein kinase [Sulfidibacter corallicola]QTD48895.1 protein kinase [Sulfidibacter corallicola]